MKKCTVVLSFLMISVSVLWAQQTVVRLNPLKNTPTIIYTAKDVVVKFDKQAFLDMYASMQNGNWVNRYKREYTAATTAIEWLKNQKKPIQLDNNMTDQSKPETALTWLIQNLIGGPLMIKGDVEVYESKETQKKGSIFFLVGHSEVSGDSYSFYFYNKTNEFLKLWNVNELPFEEEVAFDVEETVVEGTTEVVFEEPVAEQIVVDENTVYTITEIQPEYPGGMGKWGEYVKKKMKYPKDAVKAGIEGTVFVMFVVQRTGKLKDFQVIKGIGASCDKEALRLCQESIDWKPGKQRDKEVNCKYVMPIKFKLPETKKK